MAIRGPKTKKKIVDAIKLLRKNNFGMSARDIRNKLVERYPECKYIPKERAIQNIIKKNPDVLSGEPLDAPWSLGTCKQYELPFEVLAQLMSVQGRLKQAGRFLTIRRAKWISLLYPIISSELTKVYDDIEQRELSLLQIAAFYSRKDQLAEINGEDYPDTSDLDSVFLVKKDVSFKAILEEWQGVYMPEERIKEYDEAAAKELILSEPTNQLGLLRQFVNLLGKPEELVSFVKQNPGVKPLALKWLALSLRRDLFQKGTV